jgi:tetratricopeptide (TPR) repeat protein
MAMCAFERRVESGYLAIELRLRISSLESGAMKSSSKTVVLLVLIVVICGSVLYWREQRHKAEKEKLAEAANACRLRAAQGDPKAEVQLAYIYWNGRDVPRDYAEALRWYRKAADQGYADGESGLGFMYWHGQGVPQDYAEALRWYLKAANQGDAKAQNGVGIVYEEGEGIPQNYAEALQWYHKAADQNDSRAQYNLGNMYYYGRGVPRDVAEAYRWYHKAADQGDHYAQRVLGLRGNGFSAPYKISLWIGAIGSLMLLVGPILAQSRSWNGREQSTTIVGVLGLCCAGLSVYGRSQFRFFPYEWEVNGFNLVRFALTGILIVMTLSIVVSLTVPKRGFILLGIFGSTLLAFDALAIAYKVTHPAAWSLPAAARAVCTINGLLVGIVISLAVIAWRNKAQGSEIDNGGSSAPESTADQSFPDA